MGEKGGFFLSFDAAHIDMRRHDSASPKTGAWPSLLITHDSHIVNAHCCSIYLKNEITKTQVCVGPFAAIAQEISERMATEEQLFRSFLH